MEFTAMDLDINRKFYYSIGLIVSWGGRTRILTNIWDMSVDFSGIADRNLDYLQNYIKDPDMEWRFGLKIIKSNENEYIGFNNGNFRDNVVEILNSLLIMDKLTN